MNPAPFLYLAFKGLNDSMKGTLDGTKIESIKETINNFAIASALASMAACVIPGVAGVVAALTQAGFVWATYVKINQTLGISMSENTAKFLGSAILTNIVTCSGALLVSYAGAAVLSFIPIWGQVASAAIDAALGYIIIYVAAVIYLQLISKMMQPDGTLKVPKEEDTKHIIDDSWCVSFYGYHRWRYDSGTYSPSCCQVLILPGCANYGWSYAARFARPDEGKYSVGHKP